MIYLCPWGVYLNFDRSMIDMIKEGSQDYSQNEVLDTSSLRYLTLTDCVIFQGLTVNLVISRTQCYPVNMMDR